MKSCEDRFRDDCTKRFLLYDNTFPFKQNELHPADLTLSIDVLYHLVEDEVFGVYVKNLFHYSNEYVLIYSSDFERAHHSPHQVDRRFSPLIQEKIREFQLITKIINPHKGEETMSDWYFYRRRSAPTHV